MSIKGVNNVIKPNYDWQLLTGFSDEHFIKLARRKGWIQ
jgi:single-stranded-DNA-specific exonuclease